MPPNPPPDEDPLAVPRNTPTVTKILTTLPNPKDQIDAISAARNWYQIDAPTQNILESYLSGTTTTNQAVHNLAIPIEETYTTADHGRAFWHAEVTARGARQAFESDEAERFWGLPVQMCEPDPSAGGWESTEGQLWRLYLGILHAARKVPVSDEQGRMKLVRLVQALKARPEPARPEGMTTALRNDWVWSSGRIWSNLLMLGPSWAESRDCCPGGLAGYTVPEANAWEGVLAFVDRLKDTGTADLGA